MLYTLLVVCSAPFKTAHLLNLCLYVQHCAGVTMVWATDNTKKQRWLYHTITSEFPLQNITEVISHHLVNFCLHLNSPSRRFNFFFFCSCGQAIWSAKICHCTWRILAFEIVVSVVYSRSLLFCDSGKFVCVSVAWSGLKASLRTANRVGAWHRQIREPQFKHAFYPQPVLAHRTGFTMQTDTCEACECVFVVK